MAKQDWNRANKKIVSPKGNEGKVIPIEELKKNFANELLDPLKLSWTKQFASASYDILKDAFSELCYMKIKEVGKEGASFFRICLNKKGVAEKAVSQIEITITNDFKFNIHLNDYEHYEDYYFYGEKLTTTELMDEIKNFKGFLEGKTELENSKLEKVEY